MRVTSKGQVTIPIDLREKAGLLPNTEIEFALKGGTVILRKAGKPPRRGKRLLQAMGRKAATRLTTDQIMALTRGD
ncbi:MAG: AbrB/MazE/SpoVT family DNA-binding domain-containing protein [Nitrospirae bacterium]|nr:AbrB/MazE/SpoVT family DNA-binding domain-containing protein [Nitrospirota bacterium]MBI3393117.1 AbrB/MazE/SpoVT family DNA-binding domain-containing protein [Nitrospirota bacterium]